LIASALFAGLLVTGPAAAQDKPVNDYPTMARADYVFACMQVNGRSRQILEKCSCSIDVIAELLPYDKYEEAETIMSVRQKGGEAVAPLMTPEYQEKILEMKRAQVEGELRCF
jgi:lysyl-tRNA synthetase class II